MKLIRVLTVLMLFYFWTMAICYAHGQEIPTEVKQAMAASLAASNAPASGDTKGGLHEEGECGAPQLTAN